MSGPSRCNRNVYCERNLQVSVHGRCYTRLICYLKAIYMYIYICQYSFARQDSGIKCLKYTVVVFYGRCCPRSTQNLFQAGGHQNRNVMSKTISFSI